MSDDQLRKDYADHLIEQVNKGQMTRRQLLVRASVFSASRPPLPARCWPPAGEGRTRVLRRPAPVPPAVPSR